MRLVREPISLPRVTRDTGANDIFPRGQPAFITRQDVIEVQIRPIKNIAAILAGVLVPLEDVVPGELHLLFRQPIEKQQHNHARHPDLP